MVYDLYKNWFHLDVKKHLFETQVSRRSVERKIILDENLKKWLNDNCKFGWIVRLKSKYAFDYECQVLFRAKRDAALYKIFWL